MTPAARAAAAWLLATLGLGTAAFLAGRSAGPRGLLLTVQSPPSPPVPPRRVRSVDLRDLHGDPRVPRGALQARWDGFWQVTERGPRKLVARSEGAVSLSIDGREVFSGRPGARPRGTVDLEPGFHQVALSYETAGGPDQLRLLWSPAAGEPRQDLDPDRLFAAVPSSREQAWAKAATALRALALLAGGAPPLAFGLAAVALRLRRGRWPDGGIGEGGRRRLAAVWRVALPAAVVLYAGALRFEALVGRYSWEGPRWAVEAARTIEAWHPASLRWPPAEEVSGGDPFHYLKRARAMYGFYEPDVREPLFPYVTRVLLRCLGGRPLAVHAASALFSTLTVLATYLLGACAFSRGAGLLAALALAVDRDALWWSVEGFRDDAFAFFVVASALAFLRLWQRPSGLRAVAAGLLGGAACLTRVTAFSFLVPLAAAFVFAGGEGRAERRRAAGVAALLVLAVAGPFLLACALGYGDPFYAVNVHTRFYRSRTGIPHHEAMGWLEYLRTGFSPFALLETGVRGLTTYPFANKWQGLDYLSPVLAGFLAAASLAGLVLFLTSPAGRLLLLVLFTALLPYAFTWRVPGGAEWRFTLAAYPFYLIAAGLALSRAGALAARALSSTAPPSPSGP